MPYQVPGDNKGCYEDVKHLHTCTTLHTGNLQFAYNRAFSIATIHAKIRLYHPDDMAALPGKASKQNEHMNREYCTITPAVNYKGTCGLPTNTPTAFTFPPILVHFS